MLTIIAIYGALVYICIQSLSKPYIGVVGYYAFVLLQPEWNWRWHFPEPLGFQKYITATTLIGTILNLNRQIPLTSLVSKSILAGIGFVVLLFLSYANSIRPLETWLYVDSLWKIFLICLLALINIDTPRKCLILMWVLVLSQGFNAYRINEDYFLNGVSSYRVHGYGLFGDNNLYSAMTLAVWGVAIALVFASRKIYHRLLAGFVMILQSHQIMLLESRGAMVAAVAVSPLILWYMPKTRLNITALVVGLIGVSVLAGPSVVEEFMSIRGDAESGTIDASAASRYDLWRCGWLITMDNPILGVGPWAGQFVVPMMLGMSGSNKSLHNIYFEISAGCGIPAAMMYFGFFGLSIFGSWLVLRKLSAIKRFKSTLNQDQETLLGAGLGTLIGLSAYFIASLFSAGALLEASYAVAVLGLCSYSCFMGQHLKGHEDIPSSQDLDDADGLVDFELMDEMIDDDRKVSSEFAKAGDVYDRS